MPQPYEQLGEPAIRRIIEALVDRMASDIMVGFHFAKADLGRIKKHELSHALRTLGADVPYEGRSLEHAHEPHRIFDGHFARRQKLLSDLLIEHGVDESLRVHWLEAEALQRPLVVRGSCT